jgi:hypothetical protein
MLLWVQFQFKMTSFRVFKKFSTFLLIAPILAAGSAQAASGSCSLLTLGDCNITLDNVQYSGFSFTGITPVAGDVFNLAGFPNGAGTVSLSFSPDRLVDIPAASFSYTATLLGGLTFNQAQANLTGSTLGGGSYSTTLSAAQLPTSPTSAGGASAFENFNAGFATQTFNQTFNFDFANNPDSLTSVGGSFTANAPAPATVPGPVPLLGATAAFAFSRKLRSRIRLAA